MEYREKYISILKQAQTVRKLQEEVSFLFTHNIKRIEDVEVLDEIRHALLKGEM